MPDKIVYYQESRGKNTTGDYLSVNVTLGKNPSGAYCVRATFIKGNSSSVCGTVAHPKYLKSSCRKVDKSKVPVKWRKVLSWK